MRGSPPDVPCPRRNGGSRAAGIVSHSTARAVPALGLLFQRARTRRLFHQFLVRALSQRAVRRQEQPSEHLVVCNARGYPGIEQLVLLARRLIVVHARQTRTPPIRLCGSRHVDRWTGGGSSPPGPSKRRDPVCVPARSQGSGPLGPWSLWN